MDGVTQLCEDIAVDPSDIIMLIISYHMGAATMCEYSQDEFVTGLAKMDVDSIDKLKAKLPALRSDLRSPEKYKEIYNYAFGFACEVCRRELLK